MFQSLDGYIKFKDIYQIRKAIEENNPTKKTKYQMSDSTRTNLEVKTRDITIDSSTKEKEAVNLEERKDYPEVTPTAMSEYICNLCGKSFQTRDDLVHHQEFEKTTMSGKTSAIANQLLEREGVIYVDKSIGEHTIDLRAEIIVKDNTELLDVLEEVKAMDGVRDAVWSEIVHVVGKKRSIPSSMVFATDLSFVTSSSNTSSGRFSFLAISLILVDLLRLRIVA